MEKHRVYCDECEYLEKRTQYAETKSDGGEYVATGFRFYCKKHKKWWSVNTPPHLIGFSCCNEGKTRTLN